jgi:hypothetical protein
MWRVLLVLCAGCSANFVDQRPPRDLSPLPDLAGDLASSDLAAQPDLASATRVIARGTFVGRAGHSGAGTGSLVMGPSGLTVEMAGDFAVSNAPGPEVVLTSRANLGTSIDTSVDLDLGPLDSPTGAQSYAVADDGGRRNLFIFCKPFGVEIALAPLQDQP